MIHPKIIQTPEERLGNLAIDAMKMAKSQATSPNGSASYTNSDGTRTVLGAQNVTGSTMATHVGDTTPPGVPTGIAAWSGDGSVHVAWDGTLTGGIPADFHCVNLLVDGTRVAQLTKAGSTTYLDVAVGTTVSVTATSEDDACAIDGTPAHNVSPACSAISVEVTDVAKDAAQTAAALSKLIRESAAGVDVGKSADGTTYADGTSVTRQGTDGSFSILKVISGVLTSVATFGADLIELGKNSTSAVIKFCAGKLSISYATNTSGVDNATISSSDGILVTSKASTTAEYLHTLTTAEGNEGFLPAGTRIHSYANVSPYDDKLGAFAEVMLDCTQPDGSENQMLISLMSGCRLNGTTTEPTFNLSMSTKDGSAAATSYSAQMPFRRFLTAIQPVVLYNGGAALTYDTAPGEGTAGTVTLSESAANFRKMTIWGRYSDMQTATTLVDPDGRECTLQVFVPNAGPADMVYIKSSRLDVSGTHITNGGWVAMWLSASTNHFDATSAPEIAIIRVEGWR